MVLQYNVSVHHLAQINFQRQLHIQCRSETLQKKTKALHLTPCSSQGNRDQRSTGSRTSVRNNVTGGLWNRLGNAVPSRSYHKLFTNDIN